MSRENPVSARSLTSSALVLLLAGACGGGGGGTTVEGVTLTAMSAKQEAIGPPPPSGKTWIVVHLSLRNGGASSLSLAAPLFSLATSDGLSYAGDGVTAAYQGGCDPSASVTPGGTATCAVVFAPPASATATRVGYQLPDQKVITTAVSVEACTMCDGVCVDTDSDLMHCGSCGHVCSLQADECQMGRCTTTVNGDRESCGAICPSQGETCFGAVEAIYGFEGPIDSCAEIHVPAEGCQSVPPATPPDPRSGCTYYFEAVTCTCIVP
jgi:hypothetical protein